MALDFLTNNPTTLLNSFDACIAQSEQKGKITTWEKTPEGYYTHKATDWYKKAWFKPVKKADRLTFNILAPKGGAVLTPVYGYYHGHLMETFLNHFDKSFNSVVTTPLCTSGDVCKAA